MVQSGRGCGRCRDAGGAGARELIRVQLLRARTGRQRGLRECRRARVGVEYVPARAGVRRKESGGGLGVDAAVMCLCGTEGGQRRGYEGSGAGGAHQWAAAVCGCSAQHRQEGAPATLICGTSGTRRGQEWNGGPSQQHRRQHHAHAVTLCSLVRPTRARR